MMNCVKFAVDLSWVRHGVVGGTESFICNLLEGFHDYVIVHPHTVKILLLAAKDNYDVFRRYEYGEYISVLKCNVISSNQKGRILWQNLKMGKILQEMDIHLVLEPVYSKPFLKTKELKFVTVIHDLQAWHFPEYFSKKRVMWMKICWHNTVKTSERIVAISDFTKRDIMEKLLCSDEKISVIYNPIAMIGEIASDEVLSKYGISEKAYYYTVSSQIPHKNLITIIRAMAILKKKKSKAMMPLVISGVGDGLAGDLKEFLQKEKLEKDVIFTGFIEDNKRNSLYRKCNAFLFPSIFEGFGMPPIEAMAMQVPVLTTKCASIMEVTDNLVNYVENPLNPEEWVEKLECGLVLPDWRKVQGLLKRYDKRVIAKQYLQVIREITQ